jgi:hypothetical protein
MSAMRALAGFLGGPTAAVSAAPIRTFAAWKMLGGRRNEAQPLEITAATLADALADACNSCSHKDTLAISEHEALAETTTVHFYSVKRKSKPRYVVVEHVGRNVHDLYAEPLFSLAVNAFDPIEPWRWTPEADVVGGPRNVVDGRAR